MARESAFDHVSSALSQLAGGSVLDYLRHDGFPAWIDLASTSLLEQELNALAGLDGGSLREQFRVSQVCALAQRLILSRHTSLLSILCPLWQAFGSSDESCNRVVSATQSALANWPSDVWQPSGRTIGTKFSPALAEFFEALGAVADSDAAGVLGITIRTSRIMDERPHVGFPLILRGDHGANLRAGLWIVPTASLSNTGVDPLHDAWKNLSSRIQQLVYGVERAHEPDLKLPGWLHQVSALNSWSIETLESAGLGLAIQMLAQRAKVNLPLGIGFTGQWKEGKLRGVRDIAIKMQAAKEAGVFLLFACADPCEAVPGPIEGVRLILLPEGLCLKDAVRSVNRACADSGMTEFRWREAQRRFRVAAPATTAHSPDLPEARAESLCPMGFIGRETALQQMREAAADGQPSGRRLMAVIAPARSGKTTLLSHFASEHAPYPIWFSFRRGQATRQNLAQLQKAVRDQIAARFGAVPFPANQTAPAESTPPAQERTLVDAVSGRIDVIVDGLDEAGSLEQSRILDWLQRLPGDGVVVVGSQPIHAIDDVSCSKINLRDDSGSGQADARQLIASFAQRFVGHDHLRMIAQQLQQQPWLDDMVQRSGGNLWVLTEFLSAVERDHAGWPLTPSELPLSSDVREYCRTLVSAALADYEPERRPLLETFVAYRSFLGEEPCQVADVVRLAGNTLLEAPFGSWSGTGVLTESVRRVIQFDGVNCRFWSPLTREAIRGNYRSDAGTVASRFISWIQGDQAHGPFTDQLVQTIPMLLAELHDTKLTRALLFETPWLHLRMRMIADQGEPMTALQAELQALKQVAPADCRLALRQMIDWLAGWGWAIDNSPELIGQWWDVAGAVAQSFPQGASTQVVHGNHPRLMAPVVGPTVADRRYEIPWPTSPGFHPAACEVNDGTRSRLVFATDHGDLLVYRDENGKFIRERFIRLNEREKVFGLAPLPYPEVAALVRLPEGGCELRAIDIESAVDRPLINDTRIQRVASLAVEPPRLLVISAEQDDGAPSTCRLTVLDLNGHELAAIPLPFVRSVSADIEVIPFGADCWCVIGRPEPRSPQEIRLYRQSNATINEVQGPDIRHVHGACALPNHQLAVTHGGDGSGQNVLTLIDINNGVTLRVPLYTAPRQGSRRSFWHDTTGAFLLGCEPAGWHAHFGLILASEHGHEIFRVQTEPEAIPRELPRELTRDLATGDSTTTRDRILSMADGRVLLVFSTGAVVLGPNPMDMVCIEGGARTRITTEIIGGRADGKVIVCDGYVNPDNEWSRDSYRTAAPPIPQHLESTKIEPSDGVALTLDGWELQWNRSSTVVTGRLQAGKPSFRWDAAALLGSDAEGREARILHVIGRPPQGGAWVAVKHGRQVYVVLLPLPPDDSPPRVLTIWNEEDEQDIDVRFQNASGNLLVYRVINQAGQPIDDGTFLNSVVRVLDLESNTYWSWHDNAPVTARYLVSGVSLVLRMPRLGRGDWSAGWPHTPAEVYVHSPQSGLVPRSDLSFSREITVLKRHEERDESSARIACVIERDGRWLLEVSSLRIRDGEVAIQSTESISLAGEVTAWSRSDDGLALAYPNGRIEIRSCNRVQTLMAVGYTASPPDDVIIVRQPEGTFMAVSAGELIWLGPLP